MNKYVSYRLSRQLGAFLICAYTLMAVFGTRPDGLETFPFFNWSLFSTSSGVRSDVVVRVHSIDGRELSSPRLYYDMKETFMHARRQDPNLFKIADRLMIAIRENDSAVVSNLRGLIERRYMAEASTAKYDLSVLIYNPVDRLQTGAVKRIMVLATYEKAADG
ncbi:MAG: hypothetical protein GKS02_10245 [Alphaproteobacteria bacterium]|nr:hypothetical protein [Alphaproteobacteria bacterium]